jgi:hypothetical protein
MKRLALLLVVAALLTGCGSGETLEDRKREAFHVPGYRAPREPSLDASGAMWAEADQAYYRAVAETDPLKKKRLLREAANKYEGVLHELQALRAREKEPSRREELDLLILKAKEDLNQAIREQPITGE